MGMMADVGTAFGTVFADQSRNILFSWFTHDLAETLRQVAGPPPVATVFITSVSDIGKVVSP